eukprot:m.251170 g.251170  ORF g.251170 m.251170 type:complete len:306 (+) comp19535_c0_seq1:211-1128(+)
MEREPLLLGEDESCDEDTLTSDADNAFASGIDGTGGIPRDDDEHGTVTLRHGDGVNQGFTATWSNSRSIKSTSSDILGGDTIITIPPSVEGSGEDNGSSSDENRADPFEHLSEGPRTVNISRTSSGYGFTVAGRRPVHVGHVRSDGPAHLKGLKPGDQILEVNGIEVMRASLEEVSARIQAARTRLAMVVIPGSSTQTSANPWHAALMALDGENGGMDANQMEFALDPTQMPPTNLGPSLCSCVCCPLVAAAAIWHSRQVSRNWNNGSFHRARAHAIVSRRLSASAVLYGILILFFYMFAHLSHR